MSDTITCPNCSATLPSAAAFCTTCGTRVAQAAPAPPPAAAPPMPGPATFAPPVDPTRVDGPPAGDPTQVFGAAPAAPPPPPTSAPWQPAESSAPAGAWSAPAPPTSAPPSAYGAPPAAPTTPTGQIPAWSPTNWEGAPQASGQAVKTKQSGSPIGAVLAILGGILTIVGIFLPWVTSNLSDAGLSGWDLTSGEKGFRLPDGALLTFDSMDPYALLVIGVLALGTGVLALQGGSRNLSRVLGVVLGVLVIGYMVRDWTSLADVVETEAPASFEVSSGIGFYLTIAGGALVILSALMPSQSTKG